MEVSPLPSGWMDTNRILVDVSCIEMDQMGSEKEVLRFGETRNPIQDGEPTQHGEALYLVEGKRNSPNDRLNRRHPAFTQRALAAHLKGFADRLKRVEVNAHAAPDGTRMKLPKSAFVTKVFRGLNSCGADQVTCLSAPDIFCRNFSFPSQTKAVVGALSNFIRNQGNLREINLENLAVPADKGLKILSVIFRKENRNRHREPYFLSLKGFFDPTLSPTLSPGYKEVIKRMKQVAYMSADVNMLDETVIRTLASHSNSSLKGVTINVQQDHLTRTSSAAGDEGKEVPTVRGAAWTRFHTKCPGVFFHLYLEDVDEYEGLTEMLHGNMPLTGLIINSVGISPSDTDPFTLPAFLIYVRNNYSATLEELEMVDSRWRATGRRYDQELVNLLRETRKQVEVRLDIQLPSFLPALALAVLHVRGGIKLGECRLRVHGDPSMSVELENQMKTVLEGVGFHISPPILSSPIVMLTLSPTRL